MEFAKFDTDFGSGSQLWQSHPVRTGVAACSSPRSDSSIKSDETSYTIRVKLMCSYGGTILPRPQDGELRYTGGETRIVVVDRGVTIQELLQKMRNLVGRSMLFKYQLPGEDLDALISVKSDEDLDNMMEEYERLDSGSRLRVYLFPDKAGSGSMFEQRFVDALNFTSSSFRIKDESAAAKGAIHIADTSRVPELEDEAAILFGTSFTTARTFSSPEMTTINSSRAHHSRSSSKSPKRISPASPASRFRDPHHQQEIIVNPAPAMTPLPTSLVSSLNRPQLQVLSSSQVSRNPFIDANSASAIQHQDYLAVGHGNWKKQTDI